MPFTLLWEPKGVVIEFSGRVSIVDIKGAAEEYSGDRRFDELDFIIADYSQVSSCAARPAEIEDVWIVDYGAKRSNPKVRKAVVATNTEVIALADFYVHRLGDAFTLQVFSTLVEARIWVSSRTSASQTAGKAPKGDAMRQGGQ
jgi:hypothetical protein